MNAIASFSGLTITTLFSMYAHGRRTAMFMPSEITKQPQIEAAVREVVNGSSAHVINIDFEFGKDWSGDWAIFFHVVLRDQASKGIMLGRVTTEVRKRLAEKLRALDIRLIGYSDFRSESELAELQKRLA